VNFLLGKKLPNFQNEKNGFDLLKNGFSCKKWHKFIRTRGNEISNCHTSLRSWVAKHTKGFSHVLLSYLVGSQI